MCSRRTLALAATVLTMVLAALPGGVAGAAATGIDVKVMPGATLLKDGSARVDVRVRCAPFGQHFESLLTLQQDDYAVWAERHMPVVVCDRRWQTIALTVTPFEGAFHRGRVAASAYVSRMDPATGDIREGSDSRMIRLR